MQVVESTFAVNTKSEAEKAFAEMSVEGGPFHHSSGLVVLEEVAKNRRAADKALKERELEPCGEAVGVFFRCYRGKDGSKARDTVKERHEAEEAELAKCEAELAKKEAESEKHFLTKFGQVKVPAGRNTPAKEKALALNETRVRCSSCTARIPRNYITERKCRVCGNPMRKVHGTKEIARIKKRISTLQKHANNHPKLFECLVKANVPQ